MEQPKTKDVKKVFARLVDADAVKKYFFCEVICTTSKRVCMNEVEEEGLRCHVHDPERKCKGRTIKGAKCLSVAKKGEEYCWRHLSATPQQRSTKSQAKADEKSGTSMEEASSDEDVPPRKKSASKKKASKQPKSPEYVVDSEEESSSDDETSAEDVVTPDYFAANVVWKKYPAGKRLEYATNFSVNGKHILKKRKENIIVALLEEDQFGAKYKGDAKYPMSQGEREVLFSAGFIPYVADEESGTSMDEASSDMEDMSMERLSDNNSLDEKLPHKDDIYWQRCSFDKKHGYATNFALDGFHILKKWKEDTIVALLWKLPAKDDFSYCREKTFDDKYKRTLMNMGFTIDELPRYYTPYDELADNAPTRKVTVETEDEE